jgi:enoyl-CoA hydratase
MSADIPATFENILVEADGPVASITINRPRVLNALNAQTLDELRRAVLAVKHDPALRSVILTGAGDKAFVAGADITELAQQTPSAGRDRALRGQHVFDLIENLGKPVIAAVNGYALGGGCELALACDIRIASDTAKFGQPELGLGIIPGAGATQRLPRLVGMGRAKHMILTGEVIEAKQALEIGLVSALAPAGQLQLRARELAKKILRQGPLAARLAKIALNASARVDMDSGLLIETLAQAICFESEDKIEGTTAFLEKRTPKFTGA